MSIYTEGELIYLVAVSKADYTIKLESYEKLGYVSEPHSLSVTGPVYKWRMQLVGEASDLDFEEIVEPVVIDVPVAVDEAVNEKQDFIPDWVKVDSMFDSSDEKASKVVLEDYARTFGVELNRRKSFINMKKEFIKLCSI